MGTVSLAGHDLCYWFIYWCLVWRSLTLNFTLTSECVVDRLVGESSFYEPCNLLQVLEVDI